MTPARTTSMKKLLSILKNVTKWGAIGLAGLGAVLAVAVVVLERRSYDQAEPAIVASKDPALIARGRYLAYGPAHCVDCHGAPDRRADAQAGREVPFSGGMEFHLPVGTFRAANLTADPDTGIGGVSDGQIARALRYGVSRHGRALIPFMPFANLSDEDLTAVLSFVRTLAPVRNPVVTQEPNLLGHVVKAFVLKPEGPSGPVPRAVPVAATAEYGRYLAHSVANCVGCHTVRDLRTGAFTGPVLGGGLDFVSEIDPKVTFVSPNLTPAPRTGKITSWTEELFVARFHTGRGAEGSPMPWSSFRRLSDTDLQAVYRYLRSLPPVEHDTGASVRGPELTARLQPAPGGPASAETSSGK
jgi:mono/diheme cytochrome c family protein